ncbi:MAG TPA: hypothetical protein VIH85_28715 [Solirubrobacteraceae bacterium]|jgi:hypothetical protein
MAELIAPYARGYRRTARDSTPAWPGERRAPENYRSSLLTALHSFRVQIELDHGAAGKSVLIAHGDQGGGYAACVEDGRLQIAWNEYGALRKADGGSSPRDLTLSGSK